MRGDCGRALSCVRFAVMTRFLTIIPMVALAAYVHWPALVYAEADHAVIELPTELCRNYFFVPVELAPREGYSEDRILWFLHDTGASSSYVDPDSVERVAGIHPKPGTRVHLRDVNIGSVEYNRITARASELDHLSNALGRQIDGILSFGAFKDFLLTLDYQDGTLRLEKGELPKPNDVDVFSAKGKDYRPWMKVRFSERSRRMLIDSGAGLSSLIVRRLDKYRTVSEPSVISVSAGLRLSDAEYRLAGRAAHPVNFGPHELRSPMLGSTTDTEVIGGDIMQHFDWTFDQKNKRFRMIRNDPDAPMEFAPEIGTGVMFNPTAGGLLVHEIRENSPARQLDIEAGDLVTTINGSPLAERGCNISDEEPLKVGFLRDGQIKEVILEQYVLVP